MWLFPRFAFNNGIDIRSIYRLLHAEIGIFGLPVVRSRLKGPLIARFTRLALLVRLARTNDLIVLFPRQAYDQSIMRFQLVLEARLTRRRFLTQRSIVRPSLVVMRITRVMTRSLRSLRPPFHPRVRRRGGHRGGL